MPLLFLIMHCVYYQNKTGLKDDLHSSTPKPPNNMYFIQDKYKLQVAWLHNNMLISSQNDNVIAVILGHCVFSGNGKLIGKIFNDKFFLLNGKLIGVLRNTPISHQFDETKILQEAWNILSKIKEHNCVWLNDSQLWDGSEFFEHFINQ